jgi:hypothetical protein
MKYAKILLVLFATFLQHATALRVAHATRQTQSCM